MPKITKCWYRECDSDNREEPKLLFYKFPRDPDRCEQWINNCANDVLTNIWKSSPDKVNAFRVCQKHFLREFLGSSSRLVGHAVPAPYGVSLDKIDAEKFMVECASLRSSSSSARHHQRIYHNQSHQNLQPQSLDSTRQTNINDSPCILRSNQALLGSNQSHTDFGQSSIVKNSPSPTSPSSQTSLLMAVDQANYHQLVSNYNRNNNNPDPNSTCRVQYLSPLSQEQQINGDVPPMSCKIETTCSVSNQQQHPTNFVRDSSPSGARKLGCSRNANPKINYDREGKVVSIQYPTETLSMLKSDDKEQHHAHIEALKHKVRHYQRKLAVINHRYQKLKVQIKGRSNKMRLLESLKVCKGDFDPCIFEIFKRQIKGPTSKHGNRWSSDVKSFSSSIYLRSRSAYKFIRKTIDLPSESIVKRYINENKLSKLLNVGQDDDEGNDDDDRDAEDNLDDEGSLNGHPIQDKILVTRSDT